MTTYFARDGIRLYHGDCREVLPALGTAWADVCIADPPYGETSLRWDRRVEGWLAAVRPCLLPSGSVWCFGSLRLFMHLAVGKELAEWRHVQEIIWRKHNGSMFHNDRFRRVHEVVAQFIPKRVKWADVYKLPIVTQDAVKKTVRRKSKPAHAGAIRDVVFTSHDGGPRLMTSVIDVPSCHGKAIHPTQKPIGILSPLVEYSCPMPGMVVVPFAGSGSELEAARLAGRSAIGVEIDERYCELAARRLEQGVLGFE